MNVTRICYQYCYHNYYDYFSRLIFYLALSRSFSIATGPRPVACRVKAVCFYAFCTFQLLLVVRNLSQYTGCSRFPEIVRYLLSNLFLHTILKIFVTLLRASIITGIVMTFFNACLFSLSLQFFSRVERTYHVYQSTDDFPSIYSGNVWSAYNHHITIAAIIIVLKIRVISLCQYAYQI